MMPKENKEQVPQEGRVPSEPESLTVGSPTVCPSDSGEGNFSAIMAHVAETERRRTTTRIKPPSDGLTTAANGHNVIRSHAEEGTSDGDKRRNMRNRCGAAKKRAKWAKVTDGALPRAPLESSHGSSAQTAPQNSERVDVQAEAGPSHTTMGSQKRHRSREAEDFQGPNPGVKRPRDGQGSGTSKKAVAMRRNRLPPKTYASAARETQGFVMVAEGMPRGYSSEQLELVKRRLKTVVMAEQGKGAQMFFDHIGVFRKQLKIVPANEATVTWLRELVANQGFDGVWDGAKFSFVEISKLPTLHRATMFVPFPEEDWTGEKALQWLHLTRQYNTPEWALYAEVPKQDPEPGVLLVVGIPDRDRQEIIRKGGMLYVGINRVSVYFSTGPPRAPPSSTVTSRLDTPK